MQLDFQRNLGVTDRVIRILIGLVLISLAAMQLASGWLASIAILFAVFLILEAAIGY